MAAGMDDFMAKPFRLDALREKLALLVKQTG
jgi:DNA-binding response OmpR family regulator